jgi:hypothetical protein
MMRAFYLNQLSKMGFSLPPLTMFPHLALLDGSMPKPVAYAFVTFFPVPPDHPSYLSH